MSGNFAVTDPPNKIYNADQMAIPTVDENALLTATSLVYHHTGTLSLSDTKSIRTEAWPTSSPPTVWPAAKSSLSRAT